MSGDEYFYKVSYNICSQDDVHGYELKLDSATGDYMFTDCVSLTIGGKGTVNANRCEVVLKDDPPDRVLSAHINTCAKKGSASVQISQRPPFVINDADMTDDECTCSPVGR